MKPKPMTVRRDFCRHPQLAFLAALILIAVPCAAQQASTSPAPPEDEVIELSPFEVRTDRDTSYGALNSNALTRFSTELNKTPISADIFTERFMMDVDAISIDSMLADYGAGAGMVFASVGDANLTQPGDRPLFGDRFTSSPIGVRGLTAGSIKRDGFNATSTNSNKTDSWNIERVEVLRGPQGLLYGAGGPGGTINSTSKKGRFRHVAGSLTFRINEYKSTRVVADANYGSRNVAVRAVLLYDDTQQRRFNIGDTTNGYYAQIAFKLPFNSTLRVQGEYTLNKRINPTGINVQYGSTANDPRNGRSLGLLLATDSIGPINPATGEQWGRTDYPDIGNGHVDWITYASYGGNANYDEIQNKVGQITLDTVWTKWLSTSIGGYIGHTDDDSRVNVSALTAPSAPGAVTSNPLEDWAVSSNMESVESDRQRKAFRASVLASFAFDRIAITQTAVGYDYESHKFGLVDYAYYLSDENGNLQITSGGANLGRSVMGAQWWTVGDGPIRQPLTRMGKRTIKGTDGQYYTLAPKNPRNPDWVTSTNPFGNASGAGNAVTGGSISGLNWGDYTFQDSNINAGWAANYTSWCDGWISTLLGIRRTVTRIPIAAGNIGSQKLTDSSWNIGVEGRLWFEWLRGYYSYSSTFDNAIGFNDPVGVAPPTSSAKGQEVGVKLSPWGGRLSGSVAYYWTDARKQNTNFSGGFGGQFGVVGQTNPQGISGVWRGVSGAGRNTWVPLDQTSDGVEVIVTAAPTKNWNLKVSLTRSNGTILEDKKYPLLYNDMFITDNPRQGSDPWGNPVRLYGRGNVMYNDGTPFMVPTDAADIAALTARTAQTDAVTFLAGKPTTQLTSDMMGDPNSPYYAWGQGNPQNVNGQINSGLQGTQKAAVGAALRFLYKGSTTVNARGDTSTLGQPISAIQYTWNDPNNTGGEYTVTKAGESTVGYPLYRVSITSNYQFSRGWIKGFGFVLVLNNAWDWKTFYYNTPTGERPLYSRPNTGWTINFNPYYERRFKKVTWRTQINITNLFNHYKLSITPNDGSGYTNPANLGFRWDGQPRAWSWVNTFSF